VNLPKRVQNLEQILIQLLERKIFPEESYLAGGTAVYYYLHHRVSIDLDFFTPKPFNAEALVFKMRQAFQEVDLELIEKESLIMFLTSEKLKFSFFYLPYKFLSDLSYYEVRPGIPCPLASLQDIEVMKALALAQRGSAKDFVDLYYLLRKTGHSFDDLARLVQRKYQVDEKYNYHLKTAMVYFDDAEREVESIFLAGKQVEIRRMTEKEWEEIKKFFVRFCR